MSMFDVVKKGAKSEKQFPLFASSRRKVFLSFGKEKPDERRKEEKVSAQP
jgi:hypothetical protein